MTDEERKKKALHYLLSVVLYRPTLVASYFAHPCPTCFGEATDPLDSNTPPRDCPMCSGYGFVEVATLLDWKELHLEAAHRAAVWCAYLEDA